MTGDFGRLLAAATISNFGSMLTAVALPFLAIALLDASPAEIAAINAAAILPTIAIGLFAAHAIDRVRRLPLLIAADFVRAGLLLAVPAAAFAGVLAIEHLYLFAFLRGLFDFVFDVAQHAYLPTLVDSRALVSANSRLQAADAAAEAGAFAAGGWLVQLLSAPLALLVDAVSYVASAVFLLRIRAREQAPPEVAKGGSRFAEIGAGLVEIARTPALVAIASSGILIALSGQVTNAVYMLFVYRELGFSPGTLGMLFALGSLSSLASAVAAERFPARLSGLPAMLIGLVLAAAGALALPLAPGATLAGVVAIAFQQIVGDFGHVVWQIHQSSLRQQITPAALLGRVAGAIRFLSSVATLAGTAVGGWLGETIGLRATLVAGGAILLLAAAVILPARAKRG
ncbi:MAG: MFS transporter [Myxococcota bacterium]